MDEEQLRLDGNAAAGVLREIFVPDLTGARGACGSCGAVAQMGSQHLYMTPLSPGAVLRCGTCEAVLVVLVRADDRYRLSLRGLTWFEFVDTERASATG